MVRVRVRVRVRVGVRVRVRVRVRVIAYRRPETHRPEDGAAPVPGAALLALGLLRVQS